MRGFAETFDSLLSTPFHAFLMVGTFAGFMPGFAGIIYSKTHGSVCRALPVTHSRGHGFSVELLSPGRETNPPGASQPYMYKGKGGNMANLNVLVPRIRSSQALPSC